MRQGDSGILNSYSGNLNTDSGKSKKVFSLKPESVFNLFQNRCSNWIRMTVQVGPEYADGYLKISWSIRLSRNSSNSIPVSASIVLAMGLIFRWHYKKDFAMCRILESLGTLPFIIIGKLPSSTLSDSLPRHLGSSGVWFLGLSP